MARGSCGGGAKAGIVHVGVCGGVHAGVCKGITHSLVPYHPKEALAAQLIIKSESFSPVPSGHMYSVRVCGGILWERVGVTQTIGCSESSLQSTRLPSREVYAQEDTRAGRAHYLENRLWESYPFHEVQPNQTR